MIRKIQKWKERKKGEGGNVLLKFLSVALVALLSFSSVMMMERSLAKVNPVCTYCGSDDLEAYNGQFLCGNCGKTTKGKTPTTHKHKLEESSRIEATCQRSGKITYYCSCGYTTSATISRTSHLYTRTTTCSKCQNSISVCSGCGNEKSHTCVESTTTQKPTCDHSGAKLKPVNDGLHHMLYCDKSTCRKFVGTAMPHEYNKYKEVTGGHQKQCECGASKEPIQHTYNDSGVCECGAKKGTTEGSTGTTNPTCTHSKKRYEYNDGR